MDKKKLIIIVVILIICIVALVLLKTNNKLSNLNNNTQETNSVIQTNFNNETGMYEIIDENTGEIITTTMDEESAKTELEFYKKNPDYRANPPTSPNAESVDANF